MTPEEAIEELRLFVDHKAYTDDFQDMCRTAIAALEKQIAKAPNIIEKQGMEFPHCQRCGRVVFSDKYCGDCGQLIKQEG